MFPISSQKFDIETYSDVRCDISDLPRELVGLVCKCLEKIEAYKALGCFALCCKALAQIISGECIAFKMLNLFVSYNQRVKQQAEVQQRGQVTVNGYVNGTLVAEDSDNRLCYKVGKRGFFVIDPHREENPFSVVSVSSKDSWRSSVLVECIPLTNNRFSAIYSQHVVVYRYSPEKGKVTFEKAGYVGNGLVFIVQAYLLDEETLFCKALFKEANMVFSFKTMQFIRASDIQDAEVIPASMTPTRFTSYLPAIPFDKAVYDCVVSGIPGGPLRLKSYKVENIIYCNAKWVLEVKRGMFQIRGYQARKIWWSHLFSGSPHEASSVFRQAKVHLSGDYALLFDNGRGHRYGPKLLVFHILTKKVLLNSVPALGKGVKNSVYAVHFVRRKTGLSLAFLRRECSRATKQTRFSFYEILLK